MDIRQPEEIGFSCSPSFGEGKPVSSPAMAFPSYGLSSAALEQQVSISFWGGLQTRPYFVLQEGIIFNQAAASLREQPIETVQA